MAEPESINNSVVAVGIYASILVAIVFIAIIVISYITPCDSLNDTTTTTAYECCKDTWEGFTASVPLTVFITSLVIIFITSIFIYFVRPRK